VNATATNAVAVSSATAAPICSPVATLKFDGLTQAEGVNVANFVTMFLNDSIDAAPLQ
jgi:hypothetical protein